MVKRQTSPATREARDRLAWERVEWDRARMRAYLGIDEQGRDLREATAESGGGPDRKRLTDG